MTSVLVKMPTAVKEFGRGPPRCYSAPLVVALTAPGRLRASGQRVGNRAPSHALT